MSPEQVEQAAKDIRRAIKTLVMNGARSILFEASWPKRGKKVVYNPEQEKMVAEDI